MVLEEKVRISKVSEFFDFALYPKLKTQKSWKVFLLQVLTVAVTFSKIFCRKGEALCFVTFNIKSHLS